MQASDPSAASLSAASMSAASPSAASLSSFSLFAGLPADALRGLQAEMRPRSFPAGAVVCEEGAPGETLFVIVSGLAHVWVGRELVARLRRGDVLGRPEARGRTGERVPGEVGIHAVRGGDIVGEHRVYLCGPGERLELGHVATSRALFAAGAVKAARWIVGKEAGRYRIEDVLGG